MIDLSNDCRYKPVVERLVDGKAAYRAWLLTPDGAECTYQLPDTDDEEDEEEEGGASGGGKKDAKKKAATKKKKEKKEKKKQPKKRKKMAASSGAGSDSEEDPFADVEDGEEEEEHFDIDKVLAVRAVGPTGRDLRRPEYLVRWLGYGEADDTWEPEKNFVGDSKRLLDEFKAAEAASA